MPPLHTFSVGKDGIPSISDYKPATLNPKLQFSPTREMLSEYSYRLFLKSERMYDRDSGVGPPAVRSSDVT